MIETINSVEYKTENPKRPELILSGYKWYQQISPFKDTLWVGSWKLAGIFMGSLDVRAWVEPYDGLHWRWKVKQLSWYDDGFVKGEDEAKRIAELYSSTIYDEFLE